MKRCLLLLFWPALLAAAPSPLLVGSVRDQYGAPIARARVSSGARVAETDAQGTFALEASGVQSVEITCAYCEPLRVSVSAGEPVVALLHRYDALAQDGPSDRDIAFVPYGRAESVASLRPFTVLENSSRALPGALLSDRGASPRGALVLDNGIPVYDITSNQSPFVVFPAYTLQSAEWLPPSDAFLYGDLAGGGTLIAQTRNDERWSGLLAAGHTRALRAGETVDDAAWSTSASQEPGDSRARGDGSFRIPAGDSVLRISAAESEDRYSPGSESLNTSEGGVRIAYDRTQQNHVSASLVADGGNYEHTIAHTKYSAEWSDVQAEAGVATTAPVQFFTGASVRVSSGYYAGSSTFPLTAGIVMQTRVDMGMQTSGDRYAARIGLGAFDLEYSGGAEPIRTALTGGMVAPGFSGSYAFDPHWVLQVQAGESFGAPTILEAFVNRLEGPALIFDRNALVSASLSYGDLRRFRAAFTALSESVTGLDQGTIRSAGLSMSWQIAPAFSLRAWLLHANDTAQPYEPVYRFGVRPQPATVGSYWLTYESAGLRIDGIYRRDLLDYRIDPHFDASLSAPISRELRLFAATERRAGSRGVTIGLRTQTP